MQVHPQCEKEHGCCFAVERPWLGNFSPPLHEWAYKQSSGLEGPPFLAIKLSSLVCIERSA